MISPLKLLKASRFYKPFQGLNKNIWLLAQVMFINRAGAMVLPFMTIYLNEQLGIGLEECGVIMTFFGLGSVLGAFVGGVLTDRLGFVPVMIGSLFLTALAFLNFIRLESFEELCAGIFIISFIADIFRPANLTAVEAFSKPENLTRSLGLIRLAINLGYALGPFLGGIIAAQLGYSFLFIANASSVAAAGIIFVFYFRDKNIIHRKKANEKDISKVQMPWQDRNYLLYLMFFVFVIITFMQLIYIVPLYLKTQLGFNESVVGLLMGLNGLIIFLFEMPLLYKLEGRIPVNIVVVGGLLIAMSGLAFILIPIAVVATIVYTLFSTAGEMLSFPFSNTYALDFCNNLNRGKYMGFYTMTFSLAHVIAPFLWFKLTDFYGYNATWMLGFLLALTGSLLILSFKPRKS